MKKLLFLIALIVTVYSDIVNDAGTQFYFTAGIPGKDSSAEESAGTQFYFTAGMFGGDSVAAAGGGCDSLLHWMDTIETWYDAIAAQCSVICDSGTLILEWATDTSGDISADSAAGRDSPGLYVDTTGELSPSTAYFLRFRLNSDTGSSSDTTLWYTFDTDNYSDTSSSWLYQADTDGNRYWKGGVSTDFETANNWAPPYKPGASDTAIFNADSSSAGCVLSDDVEVAKLYFDVDYDQSFDQNGQTITVSGDVTFNGDGTGDLTLDAAITLDADGDLTIGSWNSVDIGSLDLDFQGTGTIASNYGSAITVHDLTVCYSGKTVTIGGSSDIKWSGDHDLKDGTLSITHPRHFALQQYTANTTTIDAGITITGGASSLFVFEFMEACSKNIPALTMDIDFMLQGENTTGLATATLQGAISSDIFDMHAHAAGSFTVDFNGQNITAANNIKGGATAGVFTLNAGSGTIDGAGYANLDNYTGGTINYNFESSSWEIEENFELPAGVNFDGGTSTVTLDNTTNASITSNGASFYDLIIAKTANGVTLQDGLSVGGDLTISDGEFDQNGQDISVTGDFTNNSSNATTFDGTCTWGGDFTQLVSTSPTSTGAIYKFTKNNAQIATNGRKAPVCTLTNSGTFIASGGAGMTPVDTIARLVLKNVGDTARFQNGYPFHITAWDSTDISGTAFGKKYYMSSGAAGTRCTLYVTNSATKIDPSYTWWQGIVLPRDTINCHYADSCISGGYNY